MVRINTFYAGNFGRTGTLNYAGNFTAGPGNLAGVSQTAGFDGADFLLGLPNSVQRGVDTGTWGQRANVIAAYLQDDWRAAKGLTLNLGLRYEAHTPWIEVHNRQANFGLISGTEYLAGQPSPYSNHRALYNSYYGGADFQPRVGFAWTPPFLHKHTVLRGAYTISSFLEGTGTNLRLPLNPPFTEEHNLNYASLPLPASTTGQGFTVLTSPADPFASVTLRVWDPNVMPAIVQQSNLSIEHQLPGQTVVDVGYVWQHGTHLMAAMPYFQRQLLGTSVVQGAVTPLTAPSPFLSGNPALANISEISGTASIGSQAYDGLQVTLQKRFSQGLQYQLAYTYSKCMTNSIGYYGAGGQAAPTSPYWQNLYDGHSEWGPCYFDAAHIFSSYVVYDLPVGRGKRWGTGWNPIVSEIAGNWQVSGILSLQTGFPLTIAGDDTSGTNSRGARANCVGLCTMLIARLRLRWVGEYNGSILLLSALPRSGLLGPAEWEQYGDRG